MRRSRGLSLIELLLSISITAIAMVAVGRTFSEGLTYEANADRTRSDFDQRVRFEDAVTGMIRGISIHAANGFLVAPVTQSGTNDSLQQSSATTPHLGAGASNVAFTTSSLTPPQGYMQQTGENFVSLNREFGPQGGLTEVELSMTPVGDPGDVSGLFFRTQRPADSDPTQGGDETLLVPGLADIRFEFYDGSDWVTSWDSKNGQKDKLPAAIRVTYAFPKDPIVHSFVVRLLLKDAGPVTNPGNVSPGNPNQGPSNSQNPRSTGAIPLGHPSSWVGTSSQALERGGVSGA